ncbi:MAG: VWA domain-containing protein [Spirochaetes bacterium]|nr:VWA domain-containing protein [Spirochaetota bacterium]
MKHITIIFAFLLFLTSGISSLSAADKTVKLVAQGEKFPEVELIVNVRDKASGTGVYGLAKSGFQILEGGSKQEITSFVPKGEGKVDAIDIVFVFDETGSMQDEINAVRDNSMLFADILKASNMDYRVALVTFSDKVEKVKDFTKNIDEFKSWLSAIRAYGGGDDPENDLDAIARAMELKFRSGAKVVFILITDAPYHQGDSVTKRYMLPLAKKLKLEDIKVYPIAIKLDQYIWMARETGGQYFDILGDFSSMIEEIATVLTAQYTIKYVPSNSSFDNTWRSVEVKIDGIGSAKNKYKSASNIVASSQLIEKYRPSDAYKPANIADGNKLTAWSEGESGNGIGEWIRFGFDTPKNLKAIKIIAGYTKTDRIYKANNRVKKLKIIFSNGKSQTAELKDVQDFQRILIDRDTPTKFVKLEIMDVYRGAKYKDTCISEVEFEYKD